jgi:hypothetical protein
MAAAGTGMQMYAADRKKKAVRGVLSEYEAALGAEDARQKRARQFQQDTYAGWDRADMANAQQQVTEGLGAGEAVTQDPTAFLAQVKQTQAQNPAQAPMPAGGSQGTWAANTAQVAAPGMARSLHQTTRQWQDTQANDAKDAAMTDAAIRRLMAQRDRAPFEQRQQLSEAIAQLAWARQQRMLQLRMDQAADTGAEQSAYGGMLTSLAPAAASFGGGPAPAAAPASATAWEGRMATTAGA